MEYPEIKTIESKNDIAYLNLEDNIIVLTPQATDSLIERIINHETIHALLNEIFGKWECSTFDNLFRDKEDLFGTYGLCGEPTEITGSLTEE
jgi:hypothetical protein